MAGIRRCASAASDDLVIVAIDGPAGAGKSTVAAEVARALGFTYVDTGALYRAVTVSALERGVDTTEESALAELMSNITISLKGGRVSVDGEDVTHRLRDSSVTAAVSRVSATPAVRAALIPAQREVRERGDAVVEGRDIGTTVFPDADVKIYLTASGRERALRRARQLGEPENEERLTEVETALAARDEADASRSLSPLSKAPDAILVDTTDMARDEVVTRITDIVNNARGEG